MNDPTRYWLSIGDGVSYGPFTLAELEQLQRDGRNLARAQVCAEGASEWMPITGILRLLPPQAPPAAPGFAHDPRAKSRIAAGLFGIFLGALGVHNFYLGFIGKGVAQLLISVLSCGYLSIISFIWGLIEGILILSNSIDRDADGIRLRE